MNNLWLHLLNLSVFIIGCGYCLYRGRKIISYIVFVLGITGYVLSTAFIVVLCKDGYMLHYVLSQISLVLFTLALVMMVYVLPKVLKTWEQGLPYIEIITALNILILNTVLLIEKV